MKFHHACNHRVQFQLWSTPPKISCGAEEQAGSGGNQMKGVSGRGKFTGVLIHAEKSILLRSISFSISFSGVELKFVFVLCI